MVWDKLWRREFLIEHNLFLDSLTCSEEIPFILKAYRLSEVNIICDNICGYNYNRLNKHSISSRIRGQVLIDEELKPWKIIENSDIYLYPGYKHVIQLQLSSLLFAYDSSKNHHTRDLYRKTISELFESLSDDTIKLASSLEKYSIIRRARSISIASDTTIVFLPDWSKKNDYQSDLYESLICEWGHKLLGITPDYLKKYSAKQILAKIKSKKIIFHFHWLHPFYDSDCQDSINSFVGKINDLIECGVTIVWTAHDIIPHEHSKSLVNADIYVRKYISKVASRIIVHSQLTAQELTQFGILPSSEKLFLSPRGLYSRYFFSMLFPNNCYPNIFRNLVTFIFYYLVP